MLLLQILVGAVMASEVGFIFLGDTGTGRDAQYAVADGMEAYCARERCDFVALLGDNIYPDGVSGVTDEQWQLKFEVPYENIDLDFYPALGNHDRRGSAWSQLRYRRHSERWWMVARRYRFDFADVAFIVLDTDVWRPCQKRWLRRQLRRAETEWVVVYGHHPVYSSGTHGDTPALVESLQPLLEERVDFYLAGHDHNKEVIDPGDGVIYVVSGAGGAPLRKVDPGDWTLYSDAQLGFGHLLIGEDSARLRMVDYRGVTVYETVVPRRDEDS